MNKICVYAIAKDEEKNVEQWVANMQPADHIIVLDTGSTDRTVELLTSLGVEVHQKHYDYFRFDEARNDSLDLIPDEYNIRVCTDLDERWAQDNWADLIRKFWKEEHPRMIYSYVWSHNEDGSDGLNFIINKIHGKDPDLRWEGAVHEHLTFMSTGSREFKTCIDMTKVLTLHHYQDSHKDRLFYINLMKDRVKEHPTDYQAWLLLGNELRVKGSPEEAINCYRYVIDNNDGMLDSAEIGSAYYYMGRCYYELQDGFNAMASYSLGIANNRYYRDNYYGLGIILTDNHMFDMAIGVLQEALKTSKRVYGWMEDPFTWTYALYDLLAFIYAQKGDYKNAFIYISKALTYDSKNEVLCNRYNEYLEKMI